MDGVVGKLSESKQDSCALDASLFADSFYSLNYNISPTNNSGK
jgi:hypothetical protein